MVALRLEQNGVHVGMACYAGRLGLYGLGTAYLQSLGRYIGVECHVLGLEGGWVIAVLEENAAESGGKNTFTYIAARAGKHDGMELFHK